MVDVLLESNLIDDPADLFILKAEQLEKLDRFAAISAAKLVRSIQGRKHVPLDRFIYGLGIRHVGAQTARDLALHFGTFEKLVQADAVDLSEVPGIGKVVAESLAGWLKAERHQKLLKKLAKVGVKPEPVKRATGKLSGQTYVITGTLEMGGRDEIGARLEALGATVKDTVTKDTDYLVVGEDAGGSKLTKAEQYGTKQIGETEVRKILS